MNYLLFPITSYSEPLLNKDDAMKAEKPMIPVVDEDKEEEKGKTFYTLEVGREFNWAAAWNSGSLESCVLCW